MYVKSTAGKERVDRLGTRLKGLNKNDNSEILIRSKTVRRYLLMGRIKIIGPKKETIATAFLLLRI